jgi:ketosteroid isomerase-like protein
MTNQAVIDQIEALETRRRKALVEQDIATLVDMMDDELLYVHSSAVAEDKALYIKKLSEGHYRYSSLTSLRRSYRVLGDVVLADGDLQIGVRVADADKVINSRYLQAWARRANGWKMISWQSTPIPAA